MRTIEACFNAGKIRVLRSAIFFSTATFVVMSKPTSS